MNELNNIDGKRNALIIMVGPPGSGKSTWATDFTSKNDVIYVSTDSIRAEIGSGEGDQSVSAAAFSIARKRISQALSQGKNAIIDATSVNKKSRKEWIDIANQYGAYTVAIAFELPREELYRRNAQRSRQVPNDIIDRFVDKYQRPDNTEVDRVIIK